MPEPTPPTSTPPAAEPSAGSEPGADVERVTFELRTPHGTVTQTVPSLRPPGEAHAR